jgi:hypothetical protein
MNYFIKYRLARPTVRSSIEIELNVVGKSLRIGLCNHREKDKRSVVNQTEIAFA